MNIWCHKKSLPIKTGCYLTEVSNNTGFDSKPWSSDLDCPTMFRFSLGSGPGVNCYYQSIVTRSWQISLIKENFYICLWCTGLLINTLWQVHVLEYIHCSIPYCLRTMIGNVLLYLYAYLHAWRFVEFTKDKLKFKNRKARFESESLEFRVG